MILFFIVRIYAFGSSPYIARRLGGYRVRGIPPLTPPRIGGEKEMRKS